MSPQQYAANRLNSLQSTGPRTAAGKAVCSRNAVRHNLTGSVFTLLPSEDVSAFESLTREYRQEWKPATAHETFLVNQMVQARWRQDRIARMEAGVFDAIFSMPFAEGNSDEAAIVMSYPLMNDKMLDRLHRYAREAERAYFRAAREFRAARAQREQEAKNAAISAQNEQKRNRADFQPAPPPPSVKIAVAAASNPPSPYPLGEISSPMPIK